MIGRRSCRRAGNEFQVYIRDWLTEKGWTVRNFPVIAKPIFGPGGVQLMKDGKPIFSRTSLDVFGADLVARKGPRLIWIQASKTTAVQARLAEFAKYFTELLPGEEIQIWLKKSGGRTNVLGINFPFEPEPPEAGPQPMVALPLGMIYRRKWFSSRTGYIF